MKKLLTLSFIPPLHDLSLLVLRATVGVSMLLLHGYDKLMPLKEPRADEPPIFKGWHYTLKEMERSFPTPLPECAILAESVGAALIVVGLFTRWAALALAVAMGVAFFKVHQGLLGEKTELAFLYMSASAAILLAGPGRISVDGTVLRSQSKARDVSGR